MVDALGGCRSIRVKGPPEMSWLSAFPIRMVFLRTFAVSEISTIPVDMNMYNS